MPMLHGISHVACDMSHIACPCCMEFHMLHVICPMLHACCEHAIHNASITLVTMQHSRLPLPVEVVGVAGEDVGEGPSATMRRKTTILANNNYQGHSHLILSHLLIFPSFSSSSPPLPSPPSPALPSNPFHSPRSSYPLPPTPPLPSPPHLLSLLVVSSPGLLVADDAG